MSAGFDFDTNLREVLTQTCQATDRLLAEYVAAGVEVPFHLLPVPEDVDGWDDVPYDDDPRWPLTDR